MNNRRKSTDNPPESALQIIETGGVVNYSLEMRLYLSRLEPSDAAQIIQKLEYRARRRKMVVWRRTQR